MELSLRDSSTNEARTGIVVLTAYLNAVESAAPVGDCSVVSLDLPARTHNLLTIKGGIKTIGRLLRTPVQELRAIRGMGEGALRELRWTLERRGLKPME